MTFSTMLGRTRRSLVAIACFFVGVSAGSAGTITVTSPNNGDFLGQENTIRFNITGAIRSVRITARVERIDNNFVLNTYEVRRDPDVDGKISGEIAANFEENTPDTDYRIVVNAFEEGAIYNEEVRTVKIDARKPEFLSVQPTDESFVRGDANGRVFIRVRLQESNMREWRVRVNNRDIPNNSGDTTTFSVPWDVSGIRRDGRQLISITADDLASNNTTLDVFVTLDRIAPNVIVETPGNNSVVLPRTNIGVGIRVREQFERSMAASGLDVVVRTMDGRYIQHVGRRLTRYVTDDTTQLTWAGRIRYTPALPSRFKIVIAGVDRAGNAADVQEVVVQVAGRGRRR